MSIKMTTIWWCFILFLCDTLLQNLISVYEYFNHLCKTSKNCKHLIIQCTIRCQNHLTSNSTLKALICSSTLEANWHEIESDSVLFPLCDTLFGDIWINSVCIHPKSFKLELSSKIEQSRNITTNIKHVNFEPYW